jgi:hypothetical protein
MELLRAYPYFSNYTRFRRAVLQRGAALRRLSPEELLARAGTTTDSVRFGWSTATMTSLIEESEKGSVRVIVKGLMRHPWWSAQTYVACDGFFKSQDGTVREDAELEAREAEL